MNVWRCSFGVAGLEKMYWSMLLDIVKKKVLIYIYFDQNALAIMACTFPPPSYDSRHVWYVYFAVQCSAFFIDLDGY